MGYWQDCWGCGSSLGLGGDLGCSVPPTPYRALHAFLSPAVLADDVLLVADDGGADPGHV